MKVIIGPRCGPAVEISLVTLPQQAGLYYQHKIDYAY